MGLVVGGIAIRKKQRFECERRRLFFLAQQREQLFYGTAPLQPPAYHSEAICKTLRSLMPSDNTRLLFNAL